MNTQTESYGYCSQFDFADFAQEFLRRNPVYRDAYHSLVHDSPDAVRPDRSLATAHRWELEFPCRT